MEQMEQMGQMKVQKAGELKEEYPEAAGITENRYSPDICGKYTEAHYNCVGLMGTVKCDHYSERMITQGKFRVKCNMSCFDYELMFAPL